MVKQFPTEKELLARIDKIQRYYDAALNIGNMEDCLTWHTKLKSLYRILSLVCNNIK